MVHKKSEYRLQFHLLANDLRKQIWLDNLKFRESCRLTNQSHHYWSYQVTEDPCECDTLAVAEDEEDVAPLPPHRLKHKFLLSMYGSEKSAEKGLLVPGAQLAPHSVELKQQQAVHAESSAEVANKGEEILDRIPEKDVDVMDSTVPQDASAEAAEDHVRVEPSAPPLSPCSPVPEPPTTMANTLNQPWQPAPSPQFRPFQPSSSAAQGYQSASKNRRPSPHHQDPPPAARGARKTSSDITGRQLSPIRVSFPTPAVDYTMVQRVPPRSVTPSRRSQGSTEQPSPSCLSHPSKTSRRMYSQERKKCPFAAFGWNDTNKDVGHKKTYNVSAPEAKVYENALRALKKRREEIEKFLAKEAALKGHLSACDYGVNHSSIWMSEYREKFGGGTSSTCAKQLSTTSPVRHHNSLRCYS
ncbi:uncharacterized protein LOC134530725 [Bacillus rossius redtenbacheri]|uniref:uncharacterized protein LOC134530725 n=1 Tax=Bacillus rossius redtenbacheri TaxID=93214 RepID=UPI002FDCB1B2